ncbi:DUF397 domain-containing protein [Streptomyces sp. NPDC020412]|uniref:DUF397 domain-containing protein n=1 Tax=Streptomyces sp. NPDC020412 TaxID=3365073 RepID=UPI0037B2DB1A
MVNSPLQWTKSTYSGPDGGECIEWAPLYAAATNVVPIRDSKTPTGPVLHLPTTAFAAFITAIKGGTV